MWKESTIEKNNVGILPNVRITQTVIIKQYIVNL